MRDVDCLRVCVNIRQVNSLIFLKALDPFRVCNTIPMIVITERITLYFSVKFMSVIARYQCICLRTYTMINFGVASFEYRSSLFQ
jgi:hypothetical protein